MGMFLLAALVVMPMMMVAVLAMLVFVRVVSLTVMNIRWRGGVNGCGRGWRAAARHE